MAVMQQMQGELVALKRKQGRNKQNGENGGAQNGTTSGPSRSADGKPVCFNYQEVGHIRRNCPNKKKEGSQETEAVVGMIRKEGKTDIPLLLIDVDQLITEKVEIGKGNHFQKMAAGVDTGAVVSIMSLSLAAGLRMEIRTWGGPRVVIIAIFPDQDPNTNRTITIVDRDLDQNKKFRSVSRSIMKFFDQFSSITRQLLLTKNFSTEIALTAQASFTFFLEYCRCFSECKMASKRN
jgi:hypothetical protein